MGDFIVIVSSNFPKVLFTLKATVDACEPRRDWLRGYDYCASLARRATLVPHITATFDNGNVSSRATE
jgi:hypothetical protein